MNTSPAARADGIHRESRREDFNENKSCGAMSFVSPFFGCHPDETNLISGFPPWVIRPEQDPAHSPALALPPAENPDFNLRILIKVWNNCQRFEFG